MDNEVTFYKSKMMEITDQNMIYIDRYHYHTPLSSRFVKILELVIKLIHLNYSKN